MYVWSYQTMTCMSLIRTSMGDNLEDLQGNNAVSLGQKQIAVHCFTF